MQAALGDAVLEMVRIGVGFLWTDAREIIMGLTNMIHIKVNVMEDRMVRVLDDFLGGSGRQLCSVPRMVYVASGISPSVWWLSRVGRSLTMTRESIPNR